jgi:hypothetical protein
MVSSTSASTVSEQIAAEVGEPQLPAEPVEDRRTERFLELGELLG